MKVDEYHIKLEKAVIKAISIMEIVATKTRDEESFKELTIGFNNIKEILGMKVDNTDE